MPRTVFIAITYALLIIAMFCIPSYFAINSTIAEEKSRASREILEWIELNEKTIFDTPEINVIKSVRFKVNIYSSSGDVIHSDIKKDFGGLGFKVKTIYPYMYYLKEVRTPYKLYYMVVETKINYTKIMFLSGILFFITPFLIFLISNLFMSSSTYSYRKMQEMLNDFFNDSMHELKTPLGVININVDLLSQKLAPTKNLQRIKAATKQMQMTYEDLEYYIKNRRLFFNRESINFSQYLGLRLYFFEDIAASKSIKIEKHIAKDIFIEINKSELQRVIDNTVSNAIKYSYANSIVKISLKKYDDPSCIFCVEDFGQGIKDTKRVFNRYEREDSVQGGLGLGLNIVKNICLKYAVKINVESKVDVGTIFSYIFKISKKERIE